MAINRKDGEILNIQELGSGDIKRKMEQGCETVLVPIGSCERHGNPSTPLGLDGIVSFAVAERAAKKADVFYTPLMPFGYAPHHMGRVGEGCGTINLTVETYRRVLEDIGWSLIYHGFNKIIFVSFHSFNVVNAEEVLFSLRFKTGAFVAFYGGRETTAVQSILGSSPERLASDFEAAMAMALLGEKFNSKDYMAHSYNIHAPKWLGPAFSKRAGTGMAIRFQGAENIFLGMDDFEFVSPIAHDDPLPSQASPEKGRQILEQLSSHLAAFVEEGKKIKVEVRNRDFSDRAR
ncbi:MAG: creatininase family protein [candidate division NC10 bacterium]|nr:creatininase family protein [candidate division NC10 bacterium]